jgi:hypothetical protein
MHTTSSVPVTGSQRPVRHSSGVVHGSPGGLPSGFVVPQFAPTQPPVPVIDPAAPPRVPPDVPPRPPVDAPPLGAPASPLPAPPLACLESPDEQLAIENGASAPETKRTQKNVFLMTESRAQLRHCPSTHVSFVWQ